MFVKMELGSRVSVLFLLSSYVAFSNECVVGVTGESVMEKQRSTVLISRSCRIRHPSTTIGLVFFIYNMDIIATSTLQSGA